MKFLSVLALVSSILAMGCGGSSTSPDTPPAPGGGSTTASTTYVVALSPANEVPPVTNADASGTGTATITITATKDGAGNVTSAMVNFQVTVAGFPAGTIVTSAHIHSGGRGAIGGDVVNTGLSSSDMAISNGAGTVTKNNVTSAPDVAQAILNNPANYYFNLHTALNPDGAVRGQLAAGGGGGGSPSPPGPY